MGGSGQKMAKTWWRNIWMVPKVKSIPSRKLSKMKLCFVQALFFCMIALCTFDFFPSNFIWYLYQSLHAYSHWCTFSDTPRLFPDLQYKQQWYFVLKMVRTYYGIFFLNHYPILKVKGQKNLWNRLLINLLLKVPIDRKHLEAD